MDLKQIGWEGMNWIHHAQGTDTWQAVLGTVMNLGVP
jgi:hypothetical protein